MLFERLLQCWELAGDANMAAAQACATPPAAAARASPAGGPAAAAAAGRRHLQAACCAYLQVQDLAPGRRGVGGKVQQVSEQLTTSELNQVCVNSAPPLCCPGLSCWLSAAGYSSRHSVTVSALLLWNSAVPLTGVLTLIATCRRLQEMAPMHMIRFSHTHSHACAAPPRAGIPAAVGQQQRKPSAFGAAGLLVTDLTRRTS